MAGNKKSEKHNARRDRGNNVQEKSLKLNKDLREKRKSQLL